MIKSNITVEVNSTELGGVLIVPSAVFTSTVQEEELDLTKTPNFQIVIGKGDEIKDTVEVSFTAEEVEYTANMKVVNRNGSTVTLQYVDGLTSEDVPEPEPEKSEAPTITYDDSNFTVSANGQGTVKMYVDGVETVSPHTFTQGETDVTYVVTATAQQDGKAISDTVTENCLVPATAVTHTLEFYNVDRHRPASSFSCSFDSNEGTCSDSEYFAVRYDGTAIDLEEASFEGTDNCMIMYNPNEDTGICDSAQFRANADVGYGTFTNTVVVTYQGITATCTVNVQISMPED